MMTLSDAIDDLQHQIDHAEFIDYDYCSETLRVESVKTVVTALDIAIEIIANDWYIKDKMRRDLVRRWDDEPEEVRAAYRKEVRDHIENKLAEMK